MRAAAFAFFVVLAILMGLALWQGTGVFTTGLRALAFQLVRFLPILAIAMLVAGFVEVLLPDYVVENLLSDSAGWGGNWFGVGSGRFRAGGSVIGLPLIDKLYVAGVGICVNCHAV